MALVAGMACGSPTPSREDQVRLAEQLMKSGKFEGAAATFAAAAGNGPPDGRLLMREARALIRARRVRDAVDPARRAADLLPDDGPAQLLAARVLLARNGFDEAAVRMKAFLEKHPDHVGATIALANAEARLHNTSQALAVLAAVRNREEFEGVTGRLRRRATSRDDATAESTFRRALALKPDGPIAEIALANFLVATGRTDQAVPILRRVSEHGGARPFVEHALGTYAWMRGDSADAEAHLKRAMSGKYPRKFAVVATLADLYEGSSRETEAVSVLTSVLDSGDKQGLLSLRLARLEHRIGRHIESMNRLDGLLARRPPIIGAQIFKAEVLLGDGKIDEALTLARAAVAASPKSAEARDTLGRILAMRGDLEQALDEQVEASRLAPADGRLHLEVAQAAMTSAGRKKPCFMPAKRPGCHQRRRQLWWRVRAP